LSKMADDDEGTIVVVDLIRWTWPVVVSWPTEAPTAAGRGRSQSLGYMQHPFLCWGPNSKDADSILWPSLRSRPSPDWFSST
jgi:hypothetical protein